MVVTALRDGPRAIGGSGSSDVMHSVCLSAKLFNSDSTPSGALGSDTTAEKHPFAGSHRIAGLRSACTQGSEERDSNGYLTGRYLHNRNVASSRREAVRHPAAWPRPPQ